ncbi:MAG: SPOR domain-containing protein, partial [Gemmatimonadales bacterium]
GSLAVLDRFSGTELQNIDLAGPARELRGDIYGQWILVRPEAGDSVYVINVATGRVAGTAPVEWDEDLPAVVAPNTLLTRRGKDVVALDLGDGGFPETGRVEGGAADTWLALAWQPADDPGSIVEVDSALARAADSAGADAGASVFLQVSSSQNPTWANELSQRLQAAGLPASVLAPKRSDEAYRVVLGPYATREQAEETGRRIGMPSFIVTSQDAPPR